MRPNSLSCRRRRISSPVIPAYSLAVLMPCSTDCALLPRDGRGRRNGSPGDPSAAGDVGSLDHLLALQANRQAVDIGVGLAAVVSDAVDELGGRLAKNIARSEGHTSEIQP